jgi:4-hydroxyphenylpyruvate dioxygenase
MACAPCGPSAGVEAVEFIEFAASDADSAPLVALISGLGFTRAARHRSKDVELFRQGGVNIVVNQDREGFAHSFNILHGPSVCALALRVDSVTMALERARAMDAPDYLGRIGPDETLIPAIAGVEGSLIYFVDAQSGAQWPHDFALDAMPEAAGALTRIDHLSNVVRRSEFLTWSLYYKTVLGLKAEAAVELADPHGAFFSRSLRSANGALRIPLNISDGGETGVSRFIDAFGGAGYQQIALATDDLLGYVERARAAGVAFLPIPDNYYADLEARFDIPPERLARMRELGVLYDRVGGGEFLHIYTQSFRDRFFFEILQRSDYDLFGAANTPVRLAAQARVQDEARRLQLAVDL